MYLDDQGLKVAITSLKDAIDLLYVKKENGKGLSTNDFTDELLQKLNKIETYIVSASVELSSGVKIASIKINDDDFDIYIPDLDTAMSDTSTAGVQNKVIKDYVDSLISNIVQFEFKIVSNLDNPGDKGYIYLLPKTTSQTDNVYDEYIWVNGGYEKIGDTKINLDDVVRDTDIEILTNTEIDNIFSSVFTDIAFN